MPPRSAAENRSTSSWLDMSRRSSSVSTFSDSSTSLGASHDSFEEEDQLLKSVKGTPLLQRRWVPSPSTTATITTVAATVLTVLTATTQFPGAAQAMIAAPVTLVHSWASSLAQTGFYQAFVLVFLSELGDKTFFIAGLLAMKTSRLVSFVGSVSALAVMTVISVVIGQAFHAVPSGIADGIPLDDVAAVLAFAFFGVKTLKEALDMDDKAGSSTMDEELEEAEEVVEENQAAWTRNKLGQIASIFGLVFAAEFGDRSFLSTIALSAAQNPVSVGLGATAAHAAATGIAVAGGSVVAKYLSEKVIGIIGGTLFLVFAVTTAIGIF